MTQEDTVTHWQMRAKAELKAAQTLFKTDDGDMYADVLFHCHLCMELALKSLYVQQFDKAAPFTHDLNELAHMLSIVGMEQYEDDFENMTENAILSRYGDGEWLQRKATRAHAQHWLQKTEEYLSLLLQHG